MGIGSKINALIEYRGRNVNDVAKSIGESPQTLYSIIRRDNNKVDIDLLFAIADELGVKIDYFSDRGSDINQNEVEGYNADYKRFVRMLQENEGLHMLVGCTKDATPEDIQTALKIVKALSKEEKDG